MPANEVVHGGRPFTGPVDTNLRGTHEECSAVMVAYSYQLGHWVIAGHNGEIFVEGEPEELAAWMTEYCKALQQMIDEYRLVESDRQMGSH